MMRQSLLAMTSLWATHTAMAQSVFCHYMIGTVTPGSGHAEKDIDEARALGFDAFALNVGQPSADWAINTTEQLFNHAESAGFKLFFSMDLLQTGDINAFTNLVSRFINHPAYLTAGGDNRPVVSTYSVGGLSPDAFKSWKGDNFDNDIYFLPNADQSSGYDDPASWFSTWGDVIDGAFGWESAWPAPGTVPANVSDEVDAAVLSAAHANGKTYMAPISSLQYKDCCGGNYYRIGEINLPQRMEQLLDLAPDFVEIITWNDAGESHYIGNNWPEGLSEEILAYSNNEDWPHHAWQPLVSSFIAAYKNGGDASSMAPVDGAKATGAMWYRTILKSATCAKPDNWQSSLDSVNYAIVVGSDASGSKIRVTSGGQVISEMDAQPGLNYAAVEGINTGAQKVELVNGDNTVVTALSSVDVTEDSSDCIWNYKVVGFE